MREEEEEEKKIILPKTIKWLAAEPVHGCPSPASHLQRVGKQVGEQAAWLVGGEMKWSRRRGDEREEQKTRILGAGDSGSASRLSGHG